MEQSPKNGAKFAPFLILIVLAGGLYGCSPSSPEALQKTAEQAIARGDCDTAIPHLKNLLQQLPNHGQARLMLGQCMLEKGSLVSAEKELQWAAKKYTSGWRIPLARTWLGLGKNKEIIEDISVRSNDATSTRITLLALTGIARIHLKQMEKATALLTEASDLKPDDPDVLFGKALLAKHARKTVDSHQLLDRLLKQHPGHFSAWILKGDTAVLDNNDDLALYAFEKALSINPEHPPTQSKKIAILLKQHRWEEAITALQRFPDPKPAWVNFRLAQTYLRAKQWPSALLAIQNVMQQRPNHPPALLLFSRIQAGQGHFRQARQALTGLLKQDNYATAAKHQLINIHLMTDEPGQAIKILNTLPQDNLKVVSLYADALVLLGQIKPAIQRLTDAYHQHPKNLTLLNQLLETHNKLDNPDLPRLLELLREGLLLTRQHQHHHRRLKKTVPLTGGDHPTAQLREHHRQQQQLEQSTLKIVQQLADRYTHQADVQKTLGSLLLSTQHPVEAEKLFLKLIERDNQNPEYWHLLGMAQLKSLRSKEALKSFQTALNRKPGHFPTLIAIAQAHYQGGRLKPALRSAKSLQALHPQQSIGFTMEGTIESRLKHPARALQAFQKAHARAQTEDSVLTLAKQYWVMNQQDSAIQQLQQWLENHPRSIQARLYLGRALQQQRQFSKAIQEFEILRKQDPDNPVILNELAWLYHQTHHPKALRTAREAWRKAPKNPDINDTLGWILIHQQHFDEGLKKLTEAHNLAPENALIEYHLAIAYQKNGHRQRAINTLRKVLKRSPQFSEASQARTLLEKWQQEKT